MLFEPELFCLKLPCLNAPPLKSLSFRTQKLFVGVSMRASTLVAPKPFGVKLLPLPDESAPIVEAEPVV